MSKGEMQFVGLVWGGMMLHAILELPLFKLIVAAYVLACAVVVWRRLKFRWMAVAAVFGAAYTVLAAIRMPMLYELACAGVAVGLLCVEWLTNRQRWILWQRRITERNLVHPPTLSDVLLLRRFSALDEPTSGGFVRLQKNADLPGDRQIARSALPGKPTDLARESPRRNSASAASHACRKAHAGGAGQARWSADRASDQVFVTRQAEAGLSGDGTRSTKKGRGTLRSSGPERDD